MTAINRRSFIAKTAGALAGSACMDPRRLRASEMDRPNVLFILTDDQSYRTIGALGNAHIRTPNIDRLVREGTSFTNARYMGARVAGVCMPSRAMLMTGRTLFRLEGNGRTLPAEHPTLPETFRGAGYETFHTGKWHNDRASFARSFSAAENIFFGGMSSHYNIPIQDFDPFGQYPNSRRYFVTDTHSTDLYARSAVEYLEGLERGGPPFFMYVAFQSPHDPRHMPREYRDAHDPGSIPLPPNFLPAHPFDFGEPNHRDEKLERWPRTPEAIRRHIADYYAFITYTDAAVGRILDTLERTGRSDDTIIVFAADNGLAVGQHGLMGKQNPYEHSIHVPLVMRGPGIPGGMRTDAACCLHDIFPTLCGLAGLDVPAAVEGLSLAPVLHGERSSVRDAVFFVFKNFQRAAMAGNMKLIEYNVAGSRHTQLFDLEADPWETENLADGHGHATEVGSMRRLLRELMTAHGDEADLDREDWGVPEIAPWKPGNWRDPNPAVYYGSSWPDG